MVEDLFGKADDVPDLYVDSVRIGAGLYTFMLELGSQGIPNAPGAEQPPTKRLAVLRLSPQHAKVLGKLIAKHVKAYEAQVGPIQIPKEVYKDLGLEPD